MSRRVEWTRSETLKAMAYYLCTPFGRLHQRNPEIVALAAELGRTPGAVAMKLVNLASCDPRLQARGISGLPNSSKLDREVFQEFLDRPEEALEAIGWELPATADGARGLDPAAEDPTPPPGQDVLAMGKQRRGQEFFRQALIANYDRRCAFTGMQLGPLLAASHIVPWSVEPARRCDPRNGLLLSALHDRAFDQGLLTVDDDLRIRVSPQVLGDRDNPFTRTALLELDGREMFIPPRMKFLPSADALAWHRDHVFRA